MHISIDSVDDLKANDGLGTKCLGLRPPLVFLF